MKIWYVLFIVVLMTGLTSLSFAQSPTEEDILRGWTDMNPHQVNRSEIIFASNRGGAGDFNIWIMNPDGSDQRMLFGDPEWDEIDAETNEAGTHLAYIRCTYSVNRTCEFHVVTYPALESVAWHNNTIADSGIEWGNDSVYSVQKPGDLISRTYIGQARFEAMTEWPSGTHPAINGEFLVAHDVGVGTMAEWGEVYYGMSEPAIGAGDSEVLGSCLHDNTHYLCTLHTIKQTFSDPRELEGSDFEMAFGPLPDGFTGLVFARDGKIWWIKYDLDPETEVCLTCVD